MLVSKPAAMLALEDGTVFAGISLGAEGEIDGEVCFNTAMTGYQEILTDPSYRGQIVTMTYPEIGNYGMNESDIEHKSPSLAGFVIRHESRTYSNFRAQESLRAYLTRHRVVAISEVDTRALVRRIRTVGAMRGVISTLDLDRASLVAKAQAAPGLVGRDLVREVMPEQSTNWDGRLDEWTSIGSSQPSIGGDTGTGDSSESGPHIVCLDFGMKWNIPRHFRARGNRVTVMPGTSSAEQIMAQNPAGVFLSNGPGDPEPLVYAHQTIRNLMGKTPVFGICLGHQLLSLALGAKTFKLKFGHRGVNQPVMDLETGKVEITTQNHGFAVDEESLPTELQVTHRNLNDNTVAGVRHRDLPVFGIQYHPEAASGPHDSHYLFDRFQKIVSQR